MTNNGHHENLQLLQSSIAKVVHVDADGDLALVVLTNADTTGLLVPSERHWVLQANFHAFELWLPPQACTAEARAKRAFRSTKHSDED